MYFRTLHRWLSVAVCLAGWLPLAPAARAQQTPPPTAAVPEATPAIPIAEFIQRVIASDELRRQHRLALECDETIKTERLDEHDKVVSTKMLYLLGGETKDISYSTEVDATTESTPRPDGKPTQSQDAAKAQHLLVVMSLRQLAPRYTFAFAGSAPLHGRDCQMFTFRPKPNQPYATREEKIVNNLQGRYWIDKNTYEIVQVEGSLVSPVTVALIASVTRLDIKFHSQTLPDGEVAPLDFSVNLAVKAPFYDFRQRQTTTLEKWRPRHH